MQSSARSGRVPSSERGEWGLSCSYLGTCNMHHTCASPVLLAKSRKLPVDWERSDEAHQGRQLRYRYRHFKSGLQFCTYIGRTDEPITTVRRNADEISRPGIRVDSFQRHSGSSTTQL